MISFCLLAFAAAQFQVNANRLHSKEILSTLYFDDKLTEFSIKCKIYTYFFISTPFPNSILYTIFQEKKLDKFGVIKEKGKIQSENQYISINNGNHSVVYFNFNYNFVRKQYKKAISNKSSSISFISFQSIDKCKKGIEFVKDKKEIEAKLLRNKARKCYYIPPNNQNAAILYTDDQIFEPSLIEIDTESQNKFSPFVIKESYLIQHQKRSKIKYLEDLTKKIDKKRSLEQESPKASKNHLMNSIINDNLCKYGKKYLSKKIFSVSIIGSIGSLFILIFSAILIIAFCTGKSAVDQDEENNQKEQDNDLNNNNAVQPPYYCFYQSPVTNPMIGNNNIPVNSNPYYNVDPNPIGCTYHNKTQPDEILPPTNPSYQVGPVTYAGVVPYQGAVPMPH